MENKRSFRKLMLGAGLLVTALVTSALLGVDLRAGMECLLRVF